MIAISTLVFYALQSMGTFAYKLLCEDDIPIKTIKITSDSDGPLVCPGPSINVKSRDRDLFPIYSTQHVEIITLSDSDSDSD